MRFEEERRHTVGRVRACNSPAGSGRSFGRIEGIETAPFPEQLDRFGGVQVGDELHRRRQGSYAQISWVRFGWLAIEEEEETNQLADTGVLHREDQAVCLEGN
jgi:hypothetical protein